MTLLNASGVPIPSCPRCGSIGHLIPRYDLCGETACPVDHSKYAGKCPACHTPLPPPSAPSDPSRACDLSETATPIENLDGGLPLSLLAAYAVYTVAHLADGKPEDELPGIEAFLASPGDFSTCLMLAQVSLAVCVNSSHLSAVRTTATRILDVAPELGASLIEALAAFDAQLQGKA